MGLEDRAEITARSRENGERIIADPGIALDAITHQQATFTTATWRCSCIGTATEGPVHRAMSAVRGSPDLIALGKDGRGEDRFTSRDMIETEQRLSRGELMAERERHRVSEDREARLARGSARP
jgi:hypothetical protein